MKRALNLGFVVAIALGLASCSQSSGANSASNAAAAAGGKNRFSKADSDGGPTHTGADNHTGLAAPRLGRVKSDDWLHPNRRRGEF